MDYDNPPESNMPLSNTLVRLDEYEERLARRRISEMADIYKLSEEELDEKKIIYPQMRDKRILNLFRDIRTKLVQASDHKNFSLLVTSVCENGGASFVSTNLAASIALDHGKTSLIVDCNLYSPTGEGLIQNDDIGFSDFLQDPSVALEEVIYATGVPRLRFVPAGRSLQIGPEYYTSYRMKQFVEELSTRYTDRFLILDAPPIGNTADARILAELCDYVLIVVPYGMVTTDQIQSAVNSVPKEKLAGLVFNH